VFMARAGANEVKAEAFLFLTKNRYVGREILCSGAVGNGGIRHVVASILSNIHCYLRSFRPNHIIGIVPIDASHFRTRPTKNE
jgi:hypothetical protein